MLVTIHYCRTCGFRSHAEEIAVGLEQEFGLKADCRKGFWGTFRIEHGGEEVYNRWKTRGWLGRIGLGHTPSSEEIISLFRRRLNGADADGQNEPPRTDEIMSH